MTVGDGLAALIAGDSLTMPQRLTASHSASQQPHSISQLSIGCGSWWLLTVGDAWTVNAGSARDLLLAYLIFGIPSSWG